MNPLAAAVEDFLRAFVSALHIAKIYTCDHPRFKTALDQMITTLKSVFVHTQKITIGIIGDEFVFADEIFFNLSHSHKDMIAYLKERRLEKLTVDSRATPDELKALVDYFLFDPETAPLPADYFAKAGIKSVAVERLGTGVTTKLPSSAGKNDQKGDYETSVNSLTGIVQAILAKDPVGPGQLKSFIFGIMENFLGRYGEFFKLAKVKDYDLNTFRHVLNVAVLTMYFSKKLGFTREDCANLGIAALFHDIGKLTVSRSIIQKTERLDDKETAVVQSHASLGAQALLEHLEELGVLAVVTAFEHHRRYDLAGYPKVIYPVKPTTASLIISICDVYDALTQRRSYKRDYPPEMIYNLMQRERGGLFDPELLDRFFQAIGIWPRGTIAVLTDESVGIVREINETMPDRPKLEIVAPPEKAGTIDLSVQGPTLKIVRSLNPLNEGERYVSLI